VRLAMFNFAKKRAVPAVAKGIAVSEADKVEAVRIWQDANDFLPNSAPSYLTEAQCKVKFCAIVNAVKDGRRRRGSWWCVHQLC